MLILNKTYFHSGLGTLWHIRFRGIFNLALVSHCGNANHYTNAVMYYYCVNILLQGKRKVTFCNSIHCRFCELLSNQNKPF